MHNLLKFSVSVFTFRYHAYPFESLSQSETWFDLKLTFLTIVANLHFSSSAKKENEWFEQMLWTFLSILKCNKIRGFADKCCKKELVLFFTNAKYSALVSFAVYHIFFCFSLLIVFILLFLSLLAIEMKLGCIFSTK